MSPIKINIKTIVMRAVVLMLVVAVVLPVVFLITFAEVRDTVASVSLTRFRTEEMTAENAYIKVNSDETVTIELNGDSPEVSMVVTPLAAETEANALRLVIRNDSKCDLMTLDYVYKNSAHLSENGSDSISISSSQDSEEYIVPIKNVDKMTKLKLSFGGGDGNGSITLLSMGAISYYYDNREYFGELTSNVYDRATGMAEFSGNVSYDTVLKYSDANIVLYRLNQNEVIEDVRFAHSYVKSSPMSLNFRFEFSIENTSESCSRYFAAILTSDNKIIPLTSETYLKESDVSVDDDTDAELNDNIFKGIETNLYEGASENGTSVAFVEIHLDSMFSDSGDGYQYILDEGKEYYFNRSYISELDAEINRYSSVGVSVYLRFLVDTYSPYFGHTERINVPGKAKYFAIKPQNDEVVNNVFACVDFIASRYSSKEYGTLGGVVLGRSLDKAFEYNNCGVVSMSSYADMLARTYSIIRIALDRSNPNLKIILPLSDSLIGDGVIMTADKREKNYPSNLLSKLILGVLDRYGTDVSSLYFMLESDYTSVSVDGASLQTSLDSMGVEGCKIFIDEINALAESHDNLPNKIFYCWFPRESLTAKQLLGAYMYNYSVLANTEQIKCYIISMFERDELIDTRGHSENAETFIFFTLKSTYKYADTYNNEEVSAFVLSSMGVSGWREIVSDFDGSAVVKRNLIEQSLMYTQPLSVKGSYCMWDFSTANGTNGWNASNGCRTLSVYTPSDDIDRSMVATFDFKELKTLGADYAGIIYKASDSLLMKDVSALSFEILIPREEMGDGLFEVKITVGADNAVSESTGVVKSGELYHVYADISPLDKVNYINVGVRPLDDSMTAKGTFCINGIYIHSNIYDDKELENRVLSGDMIDTDKNTSDLKDNRAYDTVFTVIFVSVFLMFLVWIAIFAHNKLSQKRDCA